MTGRSTDFANPVTGKPLARNGERLVDEDGAEFPIVGGIPRFCEIDNYATSFGLQWNLFERTQIDGEGIAVPVSSARLFAETAWKADELNGADILEVGSGAGRFSRVILAETKARLFSVDFSTAVEANLRNNGAIAPGRFVLAQASIYELPFPEGRFDKVLCLGVLQHTPDFEASIEALVRKAKPGGEIVVDFYPIRGWWTKLHAKYLLRPITRRMPKERLFKLIDRHADRLMRVAGALERMGLGALRRFVPLVDVEGTMPAGLSREQLREWVVLDTFDMFSPEYDQPQRLDSVVRMFERAGAEVNFAGFVETVTGDAAVVRAIRPSASRP